MELSSRTLLIIACLLLVPVFFLPIWRISLEAPQYPEGIGMYIWVNTITGVNQHDLKNINMLNHYIGMKKIVPESVPELSILPYVIAFLIGSLLAIILIRRYRLTLYWMTLFVIVVTVGLYDFYLWEYDYGHNLDPNAAIKLEGMTYQPPLVGSKQLLNMVTTSLPWIGSWLMMLSFLLVAHSYYQVKFKAAKQIAG